MNDPRYDKLAQLLTSFSTHLKKGERVLIDAQDVPEGIIIALIRAARRRGAIPYVQLLSSTVQREILSGITREQLVFSLKTELIRMKGMQAYIALRGAHNIFEASDVPIDRMNLTARTLRPVQNWRVNHTKWVVLRWPTPGMAQQASMSTEQFEDFYFRVCTLDYSRMIPGMKALKALMERTDKVHILGPGTDLNFSIKGIPAVPCGGEFNIPDGEVFTAPVKESVEGQITFNTTTVYHGTSFENIRLKFSKGRIVEATAAQNVKKLNEILDSDHGARYIGEFALGFNPHILQPMKDILFDEKIAGSFHFTPGQAYEMADNTNRSQVHWDMVNIQRKDYGGGEIRFDGKLIRKDGRFVIPALARLNPEYLLKSSS